MSSNEVPPAITRFSELGSAPEPPPWWGNIGKAYAAAMTVFTLAILLVLSPFIIVLTLVSRIIFRCYSTYHTPPKDVKVAIVGGGWSGLQCMARLKELGAENVTGFETNDDVGGTWHKDLSYHSVQIHGAMWITSFSNYPYNGKDCDVNDGKVSGEEVRRYVHRFVEDKNLRGRYEFNSRVETIQYDSALRTASLVVKGKDGKYRKSGPYDLVIYASQASEPKIPNIPGREDYNGQVIHSLHFKKTQFDDIIKNDKKVVVVGGSKTGCDLALCFHRGGHPNFTWTMRKPYLFWKYEAMFHNRSVANALRGLSTMVAIIWSFFSPMISGLILWGSGLAVTYGDKPHIDLRRFHFGILCPKQCRDIAAIAPEKKVVGSPKRYLSDGLEMEDDRTIKADVILLGTGCQSGIEKLSFEKDGNPYKLNPNTTMFNHFFLPDFPVFCNSTALWTTFGPVRAVNSADMAIYHLCVRKKLTEEEMTQRAAIQLGGGTNAVSGWLFQKDTIAVRVWMTMHIDLMFAGIVDFFDFLSHAVEVFCLSKQSALKFRVLPEPVNKTLLIQKVD